MEVNLPNLLADLVLSGVIVYYSNRMEKRQDTIIAERNDKIKQLEQRLEAAHLEFVNTLKRLKLPGESDSQVRRSSKTFVPGINEEERMAAINRMNEE